MNALADLAQQLQRGMTGLLTDNINATAHKVSNPQRWTVALIDAGFDLVPQGQDGKSFDNLMGMFKIPAENLQQPQRTRQIGNPAIFAQGHRTGSQMKPPRVGQQVFKQQAVNGFAADPFQIFRPGIDDQVRCGNGRKTVGGAGTTEQTIKKGRFYVLIPFQAALNNRPQQRQTSTSHAGLMPGGPENRACHLAKPAAVAMGDFIIMFGNVHILYYFEIQKPEAISKIVDHVPR